MLQRKRRQKFYVHWQILLIGITKTRSDWNILRLKGWIIINWLMGWVGQFHPQIAKQNYCIGRYDDTMLKIYNVLAYNLYLRTKIFNNSDNKIVLLSWVMNEVVILDFLWVFTFIYILDGITFNRKTQG